MKYVCRSFFLHFEIWKVDIWNGVHPAWQGKKGKVYPTEEASHDMILKYDMILIWDPTLSTLPSGPP